MRGGCGRRAPPGFTLIELMLAMSISVVLLGIALPVGGDALDDMRARAAARYLSGRIAANRLAAVNRSRSIGIRFTPAIPDYAFAAYGLEPIDDPRALFSPDILENEFVEWVEQSHLLKRAFREVAVIGGLVERQHPGKRKTGRQVSFSTDLIYDVLRRYEPQHLLLRAAWDDARRRMTELGRLVRLVDRASATMLHVRVDRITPMAVPLMVIVGREALPPGAEADEALLTQAEALAEEAMQL